VRHGRTVAARGKARRAEAERSWPPSPPAYLSTTPRRRSNSWRPPAWSSAPADRPFDTLPNGTSVYVFCQKYGEWVDGHRGRSNIWDVTAYGAVDAYVADTNVHTGSDGVIEPC
jgi:hypothetical protein